MTSHRPKEGEFRTGNQLFSRLVSCLFVGHPRAWQASLELVDFVLLDMYLHKEFFTYIHQDPEDSRLNFSSLSSPTDWTWAEYWALIRPLLSPADWKNKVCCKFIKAPEVVTSLIESCEDSGRVLYMCFIAFRASQDLLCSTQTAGMGKHIQSSGILKLMPKDLWST